MSDTIQNGRRYIEVAMLAVSPAEVDCITTTIPYARGQRAIHDTRVTNLHDTEWPVAKYSNTLTCDRCSHLHYFFTCPLCLMWVSYPSAPRARCYNCRGRVYIEPKMVGGG